jgi:galactokinase
VNLVGADQAENFTRAMRDGYKQATGIDSDIYISRASAGARQLVLSE